MMGNIMASAATAINEIDLLEKNERRMAQIASPLPHNQRAMSSEQFEAAEEAQHHDRNGTVNTSGLIPCEYKILVLPEEIEKVSAGGIVMAPVTTDRDKMAQVRGTLIAVGGNAFDDWMGRVPQVGDSVWTAKYAGYVVKGVDGREYRLCNDKDVAAINEVAA